MEKMKRNQTSDHNSIEEGNQSIAKFVYQGEEKTMVQLHFTPGKSSYFV
jgi:hypothetical protein